MSERTVRVFVSSPGDALEERLRVETVAERLNGEYEGQVTIEVIRWETSYYSAHETFQQQIPEAKDCDIVVSVFRAKLGTELPATFCKLPNGDCYPSGTAYEVLSAIASRTAGQPLPDVYVFRCAKSPTIELDDPNGPAITAEWDRLKKFFDTWFHTPDGRFLSAFQNFESTDDFAAKIEDCLRQWLVRHGLIVAGKVWDRTLKGPPFPGLVPYNSQQQDVFYGRYLDIAHAISHLRGAADKGLPFLALIGASDAGKSSLMRAGILPQILRPGTIPEVDLWRKVLVLPGVNPLQSLAEAMFAEGALRDELRRTAFDTPELLAKLFAAGDPEASAAPIRAALDRAAAARAAKLNFAKPRPARLILAVDQAERLLLDTDQAVATIFANLLTAFVINKLAYAIVALRSDAYSQFQQLDALRALQIKGVIFDLVPPGRAELEDIIRRPVAQCRPPLAFEARDGICLSEVLIADARGGDRLPLLQMAMARLFKAEAARGDGVLRYADYPGLGQAVSQTAQDVLRTLDPEARAQLPALIMALVSDVAEEPGSDAVTPVVTGFERPVFERQDSSRRKLVNSFLAHRLLVTEERGKLLRVRVAHEALLRIWPEAVKIIDTNKVAIRVRHILQQMSREWAAASESAKQDYAALPPALLAGAHQVMEVCGKDLTPVMHNFIARALELDAARQEKELAQRTDRERAHAAEVLAASERRLFLRSVFGLAAVAALAIVATWQWREAQTQRRLAETRLTAAVTTANSLVSDVAYRFRNTVGVPVRLVEDILERVNKFEEELGEVSPALRQSKADALDELAITLLKLGDTTNALQRAQEARDIYRDLVRATPGNATLQRGLEWSANDVGDVLMVRGDLNGASEAYAESLNVIQALFKKDPANPAWRHELSVTQNKVGDALVAAGDVTAAQAAYHKGLDVAETTGSIDDKNRNRLESDLAWSYSKIGDVDMLQGHIENALSDYRNSLEKRKALAAGDPQDSGWQHDVWMSQNKFGDALAAEEAYTKAYAVYQAGLVIAKAMADQDRADTGWQRELALSYGKLGDVLAAQAKTGEARASYEQALAIDTALVNRDSENAEWQLDLIQVNWQLAKLGDQAETRFNFVIYQLEQLKADNKLAPDKVAWIDKARADRAKLAAK